MGSLLRAERWTACAEGSFVVWNGIFQFEVGVSPSFPSAHHIFFRGWVDLRQGQSHVKDIHQRKRLVQSVVEGAALEGIEIDHLWRVT